MNLAYAAVVATIIFTIISQLLQKCVAHQCASSKANTGLHWYLQQPTFWLALACLSIGMLFWLYALTMLDVSKAYSLLSANYLLVPLFAQIWFREKLTSLQWLGIGALIVGLIMIGRS